MVLFDFFLDLLHDPVHFLGGLGPILQNLRDNVLTEVTPSSARSATGALRNMQLFECSDLIYQAFQSVLLESLYSL